MYIDEEKGITTLDLYKAVIDRIVEGKGKVSLVEACSMSQVLIEDFLAAIKVNDELNSLYLVVKSVKPTDVRMIKLEKDFIDKLLEEFKTSVYAMYRICRKHHVSLRVFERNLSEEQRERYTKLEHDRKFRIFSGRPPRLEEM